MYKQLIIFVPSHDDVWKINNFIEKMNYDTVCQGAAIGNYEDLHNFYQGKKQILIITRKYRSVICTIDYPILYYNYKDKERIICECIFDYFWFGFIPNKKKSIRRLLCRQKIQKAALECLYNPKFWVCQKRNQQNCIIILKQLF